VSKVDKATNGTDARFVDPKNKEGALISSSLLSAANASLTMRS
jgi:hypothetical protein